MDAPPVLTAERIDAMLSIMAEVCLEGVVEAGRVQKAAAQHETPDFEAFERSGRTLQRACRNLRQTIALKQRFDRDRALGAQDARKLAETDRLEAERSRRHRAEQKTKQLETHFERVLWDEYEASDAQELFEELALRVKDAGFEDDFPDTPIEALIARFADEIGIAGPGGETPASAPPVGSAAKPHLTAEDAEVSAESAETPRLRDLREPSAPLRLNPTPAASRAPDRQIHRPIRNPTSHPGTASAPAKECRAAQAGSPLNAPSCHPGFAARRRPGPNPPHLRIGGEHAPVGQRAAPGTERLTVGSRSSAARKPG